MNSLLVNSFYKIQPFVFQLNYAAFHTSKLLLVDGYKDFYQVLLIDKNADRKEIKTAYYRLSKLYHPDMNKEPEAESKFKEIQDAYNVLGNEQNKKEYDRSRQQKTESSNPTGNPFQNGGVHRRTTAAAAGGFHHGKTSAYDFDEFNKKHYDRARATNFSGYSHSSYSSNSQEDLNSYWRDYQNERNEEMAQRYKRKKIKFFGVLSLILVLYIFTHKSKEIEYGRSNARKKS